MERERNGSTCVRLSETNVDIQVEDQSHQFQFDRIFGPESTQHAVFEYTATPLIHDVLQGYNATVFAYGQTGSGKTHTMEGDINNENTKGIIPRAVEALFDAVCEADESLEFTFKVAYVEIYMEKIRDLLDETRLKVNLTIREDKVKGIYVADVTEEYVTSQEELLEIMAAGALNRATAATGMNEGSSRSHSVFTLTVNQKDTRNGVIKSGKLVLVDLAGSEMVRKSNASGQQLEEAKTINKSLSALGGVINALTDDKQTHIPYRDSKLTRILQDSLGGNSKTVLIIAMSPSSYNAPESLSTMRFGMRAKSIENKVTVNQTRSPEELEALLERAEKAIDAQGAQIQALQAELKSQTSGGTGELSSAAEVARSEAQQKIIVQLQADVSQLTQELEEERTEGQRKDSESMALVQRVKEKEKLLAEAGELLREAQKHYETQRIKSDQLLREKAALEGDFQTQRDQLQAELDKARFDLQEVEVTVETLRNENAAMAEEIAEISGDAVERPRTQAKKGGQEGANDNNGRYQAMGGADAFEASNEGPKTASLSSSSSAAIVGEADRLARAEKERQLLLHTCEQHGVPLEGAAGRAIAQWLETAQTQNESLAKAFEARLVHVERGHGDQAKKLKEMESQRVKLETDLKNRTHRTTQLQLEINNIRVTDGQTVMDMINEREKQQARSLQQRLEQLVAVHRQLLRKFAMLELENCEAKKKIQLRDERIRQLEQSSRSIVSNMRGQAERHVADLTHLKEQIQTLRQEQQERMEAASRYQPGGSSSGAGVLSSGNKRTTSVRGGHSMTGGGGHHEMGEMKTLRGGGGGGDSPPSGQRKTLHPSTPNHGSNNNLTDPPNNSSPSLSLKGPLLYHSIPVPPHDPTKPQFNDAGMPLAPDKDSNRDRGDTQPPVTTPIKRKGSISSLLSRGLGFGK